MKKRTLSELQAKEEKVIENLKIERQNLQIVQNRKNTLTKNAVTRRLCNHGRLLEYFLPPDKYTDGQMLLILEELFEDSKTREMMKEFEGISYWNLWWRYHFLLPMITSQKGNHRNRHLSYIFYQAAITSLQMVRSTSE